MACLRSHTEVLKIARNRKLKNVLILEDDVFFVDDFKNVLQTCIGELPDDWDALHLGGTNHPVIKNKRHSLNIDRCFFSTGAYAILIRETIFDLLIDLLSEEKQQVDLYYLTLQKKLNWFKTSENIVKHKNGFSEIKQKIVEYKGLD